jgi:hypothetical protein
MKPPPHVSEEEEEEPPGVPKDESRGVEEERCDGSPTSPLSYPMKPPLAMREGVRCDGGESFPPPAYAREE